VAFVTKPELSIYESNEQRCAPYHTQIFAGPVILVAANAMKCSAIIIVQNGYHPNPVRPSRPAPTSSATERAWELTFFDNTVKTEFPIGIIYVFRCP